MECVRAGGVYQSWLFNGTEEHVIRLRVAGKTIDQQADILGLSRSSINKITARLKLKYDNAAKISAILPPRKLSALETYKSED